MSNVAYADLEHVLARVQVDLEEARHATLLVEARLDQAEAASQDASDTIDTMVGRLSSTLGRTPAEMCANCAAVRARLHYQQATLAEAVRVRNQALARLERCIGRLQEAQAMMERLRAEDGRAEGE
jgi:hypothetical protein